MRQQTRRYKLWTSIAGNDANRVGPAAPNNLSSEANDGQPGDTVAGNLAARRAAPWRQGGFSTRFQGPVAGSERRVLGDVERTWIRPRYVPSRKEQAHLLLYV